MMSLGGTNIRFLRKTPCRIAFRKPQTPVGSHGVVVALELNVQNHIAVNRFDAPLHELRLTPFR